VKYRATFAALLLAVSAALASVQSAPEDQGAAQETQTRGYWIDPSTGLMWAGRDNGRDVSWKKALRYCRDLRLARYSDWRLANIGELGGIYDKNANAPGQAGPRKRPRDVTWHLKGNLFLTGNQWSSGHFAVYGSRFDFNAGQMFSHDELWFPGRALCVRGSSSGRRLK
jgi:hypothetical protein